MTELCHYMKAVKFQFSSDRIRICNQRLSEKVGTYSYKMNGDVILSVFDGTMQSSPTYNCNIIFAH